MKPLLLATYQGLFNLACLPLVNTKNLYPLVLFGRLWQHCCICIQKYICALNQLDVIDGWLSQKHF